jgi:hypothetical protein
MKGFILYVLVAGSFVAFSVSVLSGCATAHHTGDGLAIAGSPEGVRSFFDGMNGLVAAGKTQDGRGDSAFWHHRHDQEQEITRRGGFFGKLFGNDETKGS